MFYLQAWFWLLPQQVNKKNCFYISQHGEKADLRHGQSFYHHFQSDLPLPNCNPVTAEWVQAVLLPDTEHFGDIEDKYYGIHSKVNSWVLCPVPSSRGRDLTQSNISCLQNTLSTNHPLSAAVTRGFVSIQGLWIHGISLVKQVWDTEWANTDILSNHIIWK